MLLDFNLSFSAPPVAVIPVLIGPLQVLIAILPGILAAIFMSCVGFFKPRNLLMTGKLAWRLKYHLAVLVLCVVGIRMAVLHFRPHTVRAGDTEGALVNGDWTTFRGSLSRAGAIGTTNEPSKGQVNWAVHKSERFYSSPAVVGQRVYVSTVSDISPFDTEGVGHIRCLNAETGADVWSARPKFTSGAKLYRATFSSPVVKGNYLVCGEGLHVTKRCRIICLDLTPGNEGTLLWSIETDNHVECTPAIATVTWEQDGRPMSEDRVFVGAGDNGGYYAIALTNGAVRWHLNGKDFPDAETALAVHSNRVYVGLGNDGKAVCAIDAVTGKLLRRVPMPYPVFAPPAIAGNKLLIGMGNGDYVASAADLGLPGKGELWCISLDKLEKDDGSPFAPDWKIEVGDTILGAIATDHNTAWFCSANGWLYCADLANKGAIRGKWNAHGIVKASPALTARFAYVIAESGMLSAVDRGTFETVWAYKVGARPMCASSPVIAHGRVYVGTEESGFVCAGEPAPPERPVWSGRLAGPERAGNYFGSPASDIGKLRWNWPSSLDGSEPVTNIAAPLAVLGEIMLVPIAAGTNDGIHPGVICLPAQSSKRSGPDAAIWRIETANGVRQSPAIAENLAFFVDGTKGETGRNLHAVDARKGHVLWRRPVSTDASGAFAISATDLLIQDQAGKLSALEITDKAGRELWSVATLGTMEQAPAAFRQWVAAATVAPATLSLLDRQTGRALWTVNLANTPAGSPFFSKGVVYLATSGGIEARSLTNGQPLPAETWQPPAAGVSGDVAATAKDLIYVSTAGELVVVDRATGRPRFSPIPGALAGSSPLPGGSTVLYMGTEGNVMRLSLDTTDATAAPAQAKPREWLADTAAMGKPTTPMVLSGGSVYMGVSGWGLVCLGAAQ